MRASEFITYPHGARAGAGDAAPRRAAARPRGTESQPSVGAAARSGRIDARKDAAPSNPSCGPRRR